jgi:hypothetical protein
VVQLWRLIRQRNGRDMVPPLRLGAAMRLTLSVLPTENPWQRNAAIMHRSDAGDGRRWLHR